MQPIYFQSKEPAPYRDLCTDCGISRSSEPKRCGQACQFIEPKYEHLEIQVHGRNRQVHESDEIFFGPYQNMYQAAMQKPVAGAQWTGITTSLAKKLLHHQLVDGVLTMGQDANDAWRPVPILITQEEDIALARGMKMGYAPLLALLDNAKELGLKKLAVIGIPCQIYALRALEQELGFEKIYVIGTPCSDNTTTENFHEFLSIIDPEPKSITYLEFKANYHVELRYQNGKKKEIPFLMLPLSKLRPDFFPTTCRTCVDYTNSLADITIGYMGGNGEQWVIVRNDRGQELLSLLDGEIKLQAPIDSGKRMGAVKGFMKNTELAAGGLPLRQMPDWLRPIVGWLMPKVGPKGIEFARARVEMKAIETALILRQQMPKKMKHMVPHHIWLLLEKYGITPNPEELPK